MQSLARRLLSAPGPRSVSTLMTRIEAASADLPHREACRFSDHNVKWTAENIINLVNDHAGTLIDVGIKKGDTVVTWMPEGREKFISLLASAKLGLVVTDMDPSIVSIANVRKILFLAQPKMIVFDPETGNNRIELLRQSIPEFYHYDDEDGHEFHSKYLPNLKYFLHTGFDLEVGCYNFKRWLVRTADKSHIVAASADVTDDLPLYRRTLLNRGNLEISPLKTQKEVMDEKLWSFSDNLTNKVYFEV